MLRWDRGVSGEDDACIAGAGELGTLVHSCIEDLFYQDLRAMGGVA